MNDPGSQVMVLTNRLQKFFAGLAVALVCCLCFAAEPLVVVSTTQKKLTADGIAAAPVEPINKSKNLPASDNKPLWSELSIAQQTALEPLAKEWDRLEPIRKKKWLEIANKFASMKPEQQARLQQKMRDWAKLTPEQRRLARESYARSKKLDPSQKSEQWQQYQQLSEEQKKKLAAAAAQKKHVANLPSAQSKNKTIAPIHAKPKPVIEPITLPPASNQTPPVAAPVFQ